MKKTICKIKTFWRTFKGIFFNWENFFIGGIYTSGHDFIEQKDKSLKCKICGAKIDYHF